MKKENPIEYHKLSDYLAGRLDESEMKELALALEENAALREDLAFVKMVEEQSRRDMAATVSAYSSLLESAKIRRLSPLTISLRLVGMAAAVAAILFVVRELIAPPKFDQKQVLAMIDETKSVRSITMGGDQDLENLSSYINKADFQAVVDRLKPVWDSSWQSLKNYEVGPTSQSIFMLAVSYLNLGKSGLSREVLLKLEEQTEDVFVQNESRMALAKLSIMDEDYDKAKEWLRKILSEKEGVGNKKKTLIKDIISKLDALQKGNE